MTRRKVPDLYQDTFFHAKELGLDDDAAAWHADMQLQQLADLAELPKPEQYDE